MIDESIDTSRASSNRRIAVATVGILLLTAFAMAWRGFDSNFRYSPELVVWIPNGLSFAALLLYGPRVWPGILAGVFSVAFLQGVGIPLSASFAGAYTVEALLGVVLLRRFFDFRPELDRLRDVTSLLIVGGVGVSAIGATLCVTTLWLDGQILDDQIVHDFVVWWRAGLSRIVAVTPFLCLLRAGRPTWRALAGRGEFWIITGFAAITLALMFGNESSVEFQALSTHIMVLLVAWAALRLGNRPAVLISFATGIIGTIVTRRGYGPFSSDDVRNSVSLLLIYTLGLSSFGPLLAALVYEREAAEARSRQDGLEKQESARDSELLAQRERIMRAMDDGLGGQLVSILSMVQRGRASGEEIVEGLRRTLDNMRIMIDALEADSDDLPTLLRRLRVRLEPLLRRNGLDLEWVVDESACLDVLDPDRATQCLRIIQDAVTNVLQHGRATRVRIAITPAREDPSTLSIEISDDGTGDHGVQNMMDRAREVGGAIRFESTDPGRRVLLLVSEATMDGRPPAPGSAS